MNCAVCHNLFSLEGIDGAGKTTQTPLIAAALKQLEFDVRILKSPSTEPLGEFIRKHVRTLEPWLRNALFVLDMQATMRSHTKDDSSNVVLLWDRYIDSFYASNPEMTLDDALTLVSEMPIPHKTFWLDINPTVVLTQRSEATNEHSDPQWLTQKQIRYQELLRRFPERVLRIPADQPIKSITSTIVNEISRAMTS